MIWSARHVSLFFPQRGQGAAQQAESRLRQDGIAALKGMACDIDSWWCWDVLTGLCRAT